MNKASTILSMMICLALVFSVSAQEKSAPTYGGVATCKACHLTKNSGAQYKLWEASPHAKAFEDLKTEAAKAVGAKVGVADPSTSAKCLKCHVTAHGVDAKMKGPKFTNEEGVGCESCHGPGSEYKGRQVMKDIYDGKVKGADYGLIATDEALCVTCHNAESPTFKGFDFKTYSAKIAHPVPVPAAK